MAAKSPQEMTSDILKSVNKKDAPEAILVETYLEVMIKRHRLEAVQEYIDGQNEKQDIEYKPSHG
jgi:uncharacterized Fe-S cluster-containing MiaB family protein